MSQQEPSQAITNSTPTSEMPVVNVKKHRHPDDVVVAQHKLASRCQTCNLKMMSVLVTHNNILRRNDPILIHDSSNKRRPHHQELNANRNQRSNNNEEPNENPGEIAGLRTAPSVSTSRLALQVQQVSSSLVECIKQLQEVSAKAIRVEGLLTQREALGGGTNNNNSDNNKSNNNNKGIASISSVLKPIQHRPRAGSANSSNSNSSSSGVSISATAGTRAQSVAIKSNVPHERLGSRVDASNSVSEREQIDGDKKTDGDGAVAETVDVE